MENYNMISTEKKQKYQHYYLEKLINMNVFQVKKYYLSDRRRVIEEAKFIYSLLRKALKKLAKATENQVEKQIKAIEEHGNKLIKSNPFAKKKEESILFDK